MKTTKVLRTNITETHIDQVSKILNTSTKNRIAICNANTLVRSVRDLEIRNVKHLSEHEAAVEVQ